MSNDGEQPLWQKYLEWCKENKVWPSQRYYVIWLDDNGYDLE